MHSTVLLKKWGKKEENEANLSCARMSFKNKEGMIENHHFATSNITLIQENTINKYWIFWDNSDKTWRCILSEKSQTGKQILYKLTFM